MRGSSAPGEEFLSITSLQSLSRRGWANLEANHFTHIADDQPAIGKGQGAPHLFTLQDLSAGQLFVFLRVGFDESEHAGIAIQNKKHAVGKHEPTEVKSPACRGVSGDDRTLPYDLAVETNAGESAFGLAAHCK